MPCPPFLYQPTKHFLEMPNPIQDAPGEHTGTVLIAYLDADGKTQQISPTFPVPTTGGGGGGGGATGTVTAAGVNGTAAQAVQGINGGVALPVVASSLPLPTGAATEVTLAALNGKVTAVNTGAVVVASSALPSGAATEVTLATINGKLPSLVSGSQPVQITALSYPDSTANSSVAQLAAAATFTGTIEDIQSLQAAQIMVTCDQAYTVVLEQFIDVGGTKKVSTDADYTFVRAAGVPLNENVTLPGNFFRLKLTNNGASTTTTLQVAVTFGIMNTQAYALGLRSASSSPSMNLSNDLVVGAAASTAAIGVDLLTGLASGWYDAQAFHSAQIQIIGSAGTSAGTIVFEQTNDTTAAAAGNAWPVDEDTSLTPTPNVAPFAITQNTTRMFGGAVKARYVRVRVTVAPVSATIQAIAVFSQLPYTRQVVTVHQAAAANLNLTASIAAAQTLATVTTVGTVTTLTGTTTLTPGTGATNLGKAEDAVAASGDTGVFVLGVRRDVAVASASAAGDYNELAVGPFGDQYISKLGTRKRSYSCAFTVALAASATDVVEIIGSASTTVEIVRITIGGVQTTAGQVLLNLIRRSTAASAGSSTNQTLVPHQATDAAATAVVKAYTANPTTGTSVGNIRSRRLPIGMSTSLIAPTEFTFGENTKPVFLAGVAQTLCLNLAGVTVAGGSLDVEIELTEV